MKDYYEILGIEEEATEEEIRARWIELTKYYQPDLGKSREVDERMKEIDEAYEVLGNKSTRLDYDIKWTLGETVGDKVPAWEAKKFSNKKIILPVGILVFFLMMGILLFRGSDIVTRQKSAPEDEINNILEKKTSPPITSPNAESRVEAGKKAAEEIKEERPQKTEKILSQPFQGPSSVVELESKRKEEYVPKILPKSKGPVRVEEEILAKEEAKPLKEPVPQVAMKSEVPVGVEKEVPKEVVKEIPKEVPKEVPKEGAGVTLHPGEKLTIRTRGEKRLQKRRARPPREKVDKWINPSPHRLRPLPMKKR
jgi:curved DNA-binding protein CbpA